MKHVIKGWITIEAPNYQSAILKAILKVPSFQLNAESVKQKIEGD